MSALDHLRLLARSWRLVLVLTLLVTLLGVLGSAGGEATYQAHTQVFVAAASRAEDPDQLALANTYIQARVPSYLTVATSPTVVNSVINQLDLDVSYKDLSSRITATATPATVLIQIGVTDSDPEEAARIVDNLAERFSAVVVDIERTPASPRSPVDLSVTGPALVPSEAGGPRPAVTIAFTFFVGLVLSVGVVELRARLDHRVKDPELLADLVGAPVLAAVPRGGRSSERPRTRDDATTDPRAEAWRLLRTNLAYLDVDDPPTVVAVTSALPGEGKTTTALGLARALAGAGRRVCLVEADLRRPVLAATLGLEEGPGLSAVLDADLDPTEAVRSVDGIDVLTAGVVPPNPSTLLDGARLEAVLRTLGETYDEVVVDTAPLLAVSDGSQVAGKAPATVLVVRARRTTHEQVTAAVEALERVGVRPAGAVLTFATKGT